MMAHWDLPALARDLGQLRIPLDLVVGTRDGTVPPSQADEVLTRLPADLGARCIRLEGLGHLAHEEAPADMALRGRMLSLKEYNEVLDIDPEDLDALFRRTEMQAYRRRSGEITCSSWCRCHHAQSRWCCCAGRCFA